MRSRTRFPALVAVLAFLATLVITVGLLEWQDRRTGEAFDLVRWERRTFPNKWLRLLGAPLRDDPAPEEAIRRYFVDGDRSPGIENAAEAAIEGRIDAVLQDFGILGRVPLGNVSVFPPVDVEFADSPQVLVVSPRQVIRREETDLLRPDLGVQAAVALERAAEGDGDVSALVVPTGGVAAYPAIVTPRSYASTVGTAAHEWVHHYLAFYPLGRRYFGTADARTINETVASLAGEEIARAVLDRYGEPDVREDVDAPSEALQPEEEDPAPSVDASEVLRQLRLDVDALLAEGQVEEAERLMEDVRLQLWEAGVRIRRINQAYFAWFGTYAARPDAVDPLGDQLRELRRRAGTIRSFLELVRDLDSRDAVERTLADLAAAPELSEG